MKILAAILGALLICYFAISFGLLPLIAGFFTSYKDCADSVANLDASATGKDIEKRVPTGCAGVVATGTIVEKAASPKR